MEKTAGRLGLLATIVFITALIIFGTLHPDFHFLNDFVSKLGANGQPFALWWNLIGFGVVGILLSGFGVAYGMQLQDKVVSILLALYGIGFSFIAIPIDLESSDTSVSKAHVVAVCLALACWLFGLARIASKSTLNNRTKNRANVAALLIVGAMIGAGAGLWSMPLTHRMVFVVVFGWTVMTALELLRREKKIRASH